MKTVKGCWTVIWQPFLCFGTKQRIGEYIRGMIDLTFNEFVLERELDYQYEGPCLVR